jgi:hypothetical protein
LKQVKRGQTIRVLDGATYPEALELSNPDRYDGITLEAVQKATIRPPSTAPIVGFLVHGVSEVTVRGFRMELGEGRTQYLAGIVGKSPGVVFDGLELTTSRRLNTCAIGLETIEFSRAEPPVIVRNCTIQGFNFGIRVIGEAQGNATRCRGVTIRENKLFSCVVGIWTGGWINDMHVVGNRVWGCGTCDIELAGLTEDSSDILLANNTLLDARCCVQIQDPIRGARQIEIRNNLLLAKEEELDILFLGKDPQPLKEWRLDHNWRQVQAPMSGTPAYRKWVRSADDTIRDSIELLSRDPQSSGFLNPAMGSSLATAGAGDDLPKYVGAVPPDGTAPWDWGRTWKARVK